jgi:hypothetical protein
MKEILPLAQSLAPDTIKRLERAAELRHDDALVLMKNVNLLGALYLFGHSAEMCLTAAYFRSAGCTGMTVIDRDTRRQHMTRARTIEAEDGLPLMNSDPHPIVGWARYLRYRRSGSNLSESQAQRLNEAITKAQVLYRHWRPELRYKTVDAKAGQMSEVFSASAWFLDQRGRL